MSTEIDEKLFEQIFGHTLVKLVDKLINTEKKKESQIIVKNIEKSKDKLFKEDEFYNFAIQVLTTFWFKIHYWFYSKL